MDLMKLLPEKRDGEHRGIRPSPVLIMAGVIGVLVLIIAVLFVRGNHMGRKYDDIAKKYDELIHKMETEPQIDVAYIGNKLESISELATAKMTYNGIIHFEEGKIPLITKKEFYMSYRVSMKAGFNLEQAEINVTEHTVTIDLPEAEIYEPTMYEDSLQLFDKSFSIFNPEKIEDLAQAISEAKADALAQPETQEMKARAEEQAVLLLTALLDGQIGARDLIINIG